MLINGEISSEIEATDRGLAYGDGLFSTIKVEHGVVIDWTLHLARLQLGAKRLFFPKVDWNKLQQDIFDSAQSVKEIPHHVLKVMLTRGSGGRGYSADGCETPNTIISLSPFPDIYLQWQQHGIAIIKCETELGRNKQLAGLKTLARLEQVLIKQELSAKGALEGVVSDELGNVIEACSANVFAYINGQWVTPKLDYAGVAGVMRSRILQNPSIKVVEKNINLNDLQQATCLCLTNALMGVVPVRKYQETMYNDKQLEPVMMLQAMLNKEDVNHD